MEKSIKEMTEKELVEENQKSMEYLSRMDVSLSDDLHKMYSKKILAISDELSKRRNKIFDGKPTIIKFGSEEILNIQLKMIKLGKKLDKKTSEIDEKIRIASKKRENFDLFWNCIAGDHEIIKLYLLRNKTRKPLLKKMEEMFSLLMTYKID